MKQQYNQALGHSMLEDAKIGLSTTLMDTRLGLGVYMDDYGRYILYTFAGTDSIWFPVPKHQLRIVRDADQSSYSLQQVTEAGIVDIATYVSLDPWSEMDKKMKSYWDAYFENNP